MVSKYHIYLNIIVNYTCRHHYKTIFTFIILSALFGENSLSVNATEILTATKFSTAPTLLFSDLTNGPSGSIVTIWGQNIPKDSKLICGDQPCDIISFINDPSHPPHGMQPSIQMIVVRFYSGSGITLENYNTLPFRLTNGNIHIIKPGKISLNRINDGDIVYLRGGTYNVPQGGSINSIILPKNGVSIVAYPGERVVIDCSKASAVNTYNSERFLRDFTISKLEMDCGDSRPSIAIKAIASKHNNLRVIGNYVHNSHPGHSGAFGEFSNTVDLYILGNLVENTGVMGGKNAHAIYHGGRGISSNVNINYNRILNHSGGRAIQVYGHKENESLTKLTIKGNNIQQINGKTGIILSSSDSPKGLPPYDPKKGWIKDAVIEDNTIGNITGPGIEIRNAGIDVVIQRNVIFNASDSILISLAKSAKIMNNCTDKQIRSNIAVTDYNNKDNYPACLLNK